MRTLNKLIFLLVLGISTLNAGTWKSVGLDSLKVNCLINVYETVIAGTERGLYLLDNDSLKQWIKYSGVPNLPVNDIVFGKNQELIASVGLGSNSDGIYGGVGVYDGAPYYEFSLSQYFDFPQAIGYFNDTLLIGSKNTLHYAIRDSVQSSIQGISFKDPEPINIPQNSFGVENPVVSDIHYTFSGGYFLVAGYDNSPEPARGSLLTVTTSMGTKLLDSSTTSLYEHYQGWSLFSDLYVGGTNSLLKSTSDQINTKRNYTDFSEISVPNNSRVNHVTGIMASPIIIDGVADICIATDDGVFKKELNDSWSEFGDIPEAPNMTTSVFKTLSEGTGLYDMGYIYAATDKGVYRYDFYNSTPISSKISSSKNLLNNIIVNNKTLQIKTNGLNIKTINVYNLSGKLISNLSISDLKEVNINLNKMNLSNGAYLINLKTDKGNFKGKFNFTK